MNLSQDYFRDASDDVESSSRLVERRSHDARTDPRSGIVPVIYGKDGRHNPKLVEAFLRENTCACWDLNSITPFVSLMRSDTRWDGLLSTFPTYREISPQNQTQLWYIAQHWDLEKTRMRIGSAISEIQDVFKTNSNAALRQILLELRHEIESEQALPEAVTPSPSTDVKLEPEGRVECPRCQDSVADENTRITTQPDGTSRAQPGATNTEVEVEQAALPANFLIPLTTPKPLYDEVSDPFVKRSLLRLDKRISTVVQLRGKYLIEHLNKEANMKEEQLSLLRKEESQGNQVNDALMHLEALGDECALAFKEGEAPGGSNWMLKALKTQVMEKSNKRPRDYEAEKSALGEDIKRIKTKSATLESEQESIEEVVALHCQENDVRAPNEPGLPRLLNKENVSILL